MEAPDAGNWRAGNPLAPNPVKKPRPRSASPPKPTPSESPRREKWKSSAVGGPERVVAWAGVHEHALVRRERAGAP